MKTTKSTSKKSGTKKKVTEVTTGSADVDNELPAAVPAAKSKSKSLKTSTKTKPTATNMEYSETKPGKNDIIDDEDDLESFLNS